MSFTSDPPVRIQPTNSPVNFAVAAVSDSNEDVSDPDDSLRAGSVIDGITLVNTQAVLLRGQSDPTKNGVWIIHTGSVPTRSSTFADYAASGRQVTAICVGAGSAHPVGSRFHMRGVALVVGDDDLHFDYVSAAAADVGSFTPTGNSPQPIWY